MFSIILFKGEMGPLCETAATAVQGDCGACCNTVVSPHEGALHQVDRDYKASSSPTALFLVFRRQLEMLFFQTKLIQV